MGNTQYKEKFYNLLLGMFLGDAEIEGQGGYINLLKIKRKKAEGIENKFKVVMTALQTIPHYSYSREMKHLLTERNIIDLNKDNVIIKDFKGVIEILYEFFREKGITDIESLKVRVKHVGWYYEV